MNESHHHRSNEVTIRRCTEGCLVLQFGLTMVHLDEPLFRKFAQIVIATSVQLDQEQRLRKVAQLNAEPCHGRVEPGELDRGFEA